MQQGEILAVLTGPSTTCELSARFLSEPSHFGSQSTHSHLTQHHPRPIPPQSLDKSKIPLRLWQDLSNLLAIVSLVRRIGSFRSSIRSSSSNNDRQPLLGRPTSIASSIATSHSLSTTAYSPSIASQNQVGKKTSVLATSESSLQPIEEEERGSKYISLSSIFLLASSQFQPRLPLGYLSKNNATLTRRRQPTLRKSG